MTIDPRKRAPSDDELARERARTELANADEAARESEALASAWWVYVLIACDERRTYVGSSNDPERRLRQHNGLAQGGAAHTRAHRPWSIAKTYGPFASRADAQRAEWRVKRLAGAQRLSWIPLP